MSAHEELLEAHQKAIDFFVESFKQEIGTNSELAQSLTKQQSGSASKSPWDHVEGTIIKKRKCL